MNAGLAQGNSPLLSQVQLDHLPVPMVILRGASPEAMRLERLNQRASELLGLAPQPLPLAAGAFFALLHADDRPSLAQAWRMALAHGTPLRWEGRLQHPTPTRWVELKAEAVGPDLWQGVLIDGSALHEENRTLQRNIEEWRHVLDSVPIAIAIARLDGDDPAITYINKQFVRSFGYSHAQLRHVSDWKRLAYPDPTYRGAVFEQWDRAVERAHSAQGSVEWMEFTVTAADGSQREVLFSARVLAEELLVTLLDGSERRRVEKELSVAREQLAQTALEVTEAIPVGTYTMVLRPGSPLASFSFMSERFLELTGLQREEALADPLKAFACVHPDDYDAWVQLNAEVFEKKLPFFGQTRVVVNGQVRWITAESVPRDLPDGSTVWEGVLIDVTDRIEAQQQLERNQKQLERILDNIPVAIAINSLDPEDPEITFLNAHFIRTLGYTRAVVPRVSDWARLAYPDPAYRKAVFDDWSGAMARAVARHGAVEQAEYQVRSADGRDLQMLISSVVLEDMILIALMDVTESRETERQLMAALMRERDQEEQLRKGIEEKLRVSLSASAVAHEISQPLGAILINSQMALSSLNAPREPEPADLRMLLETLVNEARRMHLITERIRMLLRQVDTRRRQVDLREVVASAELQFQSERLAAGLELTRTLPAEAAMVEGDPVQLQLALLNLLRNGLEATREAAQPAPHRSRLQLSLHQQGSWLELVVADNGPGFPADYEPQLPLNSTKAGGSGIGLYMVRLTMANHGGSLRVGRSAELGGAEVVLQLPLAEAPPGPAEGAALA